MPVSVATDRHNPTPKKSGDIRHTLALKQTMYTDMIRYFQSCKKLRSFIFHPQHKLMWTTQRFANNGMDMIDGWH